MRYVAAAVMVWLGAAVLHSGPVSADSAGQALAQRVYDRPDGTDVSTRGLMILTDKGKSPRVRQMYTYGLETGPGEKRTLIRFTSPADIDGTGMLTLDYPGDKTDQWLYLPALDRSRVISSGRKGGRFVGSDLFYEDLRDREVTMDRHRIIGKEEVLGTLCDVLESTPLDPDNSVYAKRISWVHPGTLIPLRVDYFKPGRDEPIKRSIVHRIEKIQGFWTVMDSTMSDLTSGHETRLKVEAIVYDRGLPAELFGRQVLEDPVREAQHRPK